MIAVECACGKKARVKDELAGRKIKCPECKETLVVPGERLVTPPGGIPAGGDEDEAPKKKDAFAGLPRKTPAGGVPKKAIGGKVDEEAGDAAPGTKSAFAGLPRKKTKGGDGDGDDGSAGGDEKPCPFCAEPIKRAAKKCRHCGESLVEGGGKADGRKRDVAHECHIRAIAIWYRIAGLLVGLMALATGLLMFAGGGARAAGFVMVMSGFLLALAAASYAIGHFLFNYSSGARIAALILSALSVGLNLLQIVAAGFKLPMVMSNGLSIAYTCAVLWAIGGSQGGAICTASYQQLVARTPDVKVPFWTSPFFWIPAGMLVLGLFLGLFAATR